MRTDTYGYPHQHPVTVDDQKAAMAQHFAGKRPTYADCGICGANHPAAYAGDCRNDLFRIADPDELHGPSGWDAIGAEEEVA